MGGAVYFLLYQCYFWLSHDSDNWSVGSGDVIFYADVSTFHLIVLTVIDDCCSITISLGVTK